MKVYRSRWHEGGCANYHQTGCADWGGPLSPPAEGGPSWQSDWCLFQQASCPGHRPMDKELGSNAWDSAAGSSIHILCFCTAAPGPPRPPPPPLPPPLPPPSPPPPLLPLNCPEGMVSQVSRGFQFCFGAATATKAEAAARCAEQRLQLLELRTPEKVEAWRALHPGTPRVGTWGSTSGWGATEQAAESVRQRASNARGTRFTRCFTRCALASCC